MGLMALLLIMTTVHLFQAFPDLREHHGTTNCASLGIAASAAFARSSGIAAQRASAGTIARRARSPGALSIEMTKARVRKCAHLRRTPLRPVGGAA